MAEGTGKTQTVIVIRHGERIDHVDPHWVQRNERSYDPPLTKTGEVQAKEVGIELNKKDIQCVISSPFIRCLQTAQPICDALGLPGITTCNGIVDVLTYHFGIYEAPKVPAEDIADHGIKVVSFDSKPLPTFPEHFKEGMERYNREINRLADEYWPKNVIIVTHMFGVTQAESLTKGEQYNGVSWANYCGYVEMSRTAKDSRDWKLMSAVGIED